MPQATLSELRDEGEAVNGKQPARRLFLACGVVAACVTPGTPAGDPSSEIGELLSRSAAQWNHGDLDGFMADYAPDSLTSFVAGRGVLYGWQTLYDRYEAAFFAPGKARDSLTFETLRVRVLSPTLALATARFALHRADSLIASGPFTLVLERRNGRWLILHDHTSSDPRP
jgi:uncharacterized protein (TIGR02246 family)